MDAIILAGGKGTRLKDVISDVPKPLAPINGTSFLDLLIDQLNSFEEINNIILSVGYKKEKIINRYSDKKNILFSKEDSPLGTGGAIKKAMTLVTSDTALVLNGDTFQNFNLKAILDSHVKKNATITIVYRKANNTNRYGNIMVDDYNRIVSFEEKKDSNSGFINSGIYLMAKKSFEDFKEESFSIENDFFPNILKTKKTYGFENSSIFIDIGTKNSYVQAQNILKK